MGLHGISVASNDTPLANRKMTSKQTNSNLLANDAPVPGLYKHYKGNLYQVFGLARHSETEEWLVVYQALYGEKGHWIRPLTLWLEPVTNLPNTTGSASNDSVQRFVLIEPNDNSLDQLSQSK